MNKQTLADKARLFQALHKGNAMFIIPNVWNAGSARIFEKEGFPCVATTSAGIAYMLGHADGEKVSIDDLALATSQITNRVNIPVSCDFERGYSENLATIKENARKLLNAGAVGFNIEDGALDGKSLEALDKQLFKIKAMLEVKKETGIDFVINARSCVYWSGIGTEEEKLQTAITRGNAFLNAGADCVFIPGAINEATVQAIVNGINGPLNIILNSKFHNIEKLGQHGVRRLSIGSGAARSTADHLIQIAKDLKKNNTDTMLDCAFTYAMANDYFKD